MNNKELEALLEEIKDELITNLYDNVECPKCFYSFITKKEKTTSDLIGKIFTVIEEINND